jgi:hypothetical protein
LDFWIINIPKYNKFRSISHLITIFVLISTSRSSDRMII